MPTAVQSALALAHAALERGRGAEAVQILTPLHRSGALAREDDIAVRAAMAEGCLLQDDLTQAAAMLGRPPDALREPLSHAQLSTLWRLHGKLTFAKGEQSRAIALHTRALKDAELARDSRLIGLAHYELAMCYKQVGDSSIVHEHLTEASSALHAAGDRRHLALVHRLSAVLLAQAGRPDDASTALRQGERLANTIHADDVLAGIVHNQANIALMRNRHEEALALAERSVALHQSIGSGHGLAVALATLGQIFVQLGDLDRAEHVLTRTLEVRSPVQFHETTGAVFDTLAQIHMMRGSYERAEEYLRLAGDAYGSQTMRWYEWSLKVLAVKLAVRRRAYDRALAMADELAQTPGIPPFEELQASLVACEALLEAGRVEEARRRLHGCEERLDPRGSTANWAEYLRVRGAIQAQSGHESSAHHDFAQSATVFELLGERYQAAVSHLCVARLAASMGARSTAHRHLDLARPVFTTLGAQRDLQEVARIQLALAQQPATVTRASVSDADDAIVTRLVEAAVFPALLARETTASLVETLEPRVAVVYTVMPDGQLRVVAGAGPSHDLAEPVAATSADGGRSFADGHLATEPLGRSADGARFCAVLTSQPLSDTDARRYRMFATIARQGFELCGARERPVQAAEAVVERKLEPLLPGFICASAAMNRVADQIQRLQGNTLTVLITGESGTGKDLVARAIHSGSGRSAGMYLPFNCTTTTRELADSHLFGHKRGSFTGAVTDQQGLIRAAAGGTLFLDEVGDLPLDIQPRLLRFLEQGEIMPVGETRPLAVDVRVLAATNADLEQRVAEGTFREDLYYRLSVIRIHVPPLRERREEIPHLSTFFLREACERLVKPDVHLSSATLDLFARYWWPGNVRQLRNEIQRAVAMSAPGSAIEPEHLSTELSAIGVGGVPGDRQSAAPLAVQAASLAAAIEQLERDYITGALDQTGRNIAAAARLLGLTRRGLYLKMSRLGVAPPS